MTFDEIWEQTKKEWAFPSILIGSDEDFLPRFLKMMAKYFYEKGGIMDKRFVVVTTDKDRHGVFAGYLEKQDGTNVTLSEARMCVYWSEDIHGVVSLANPGPSKYCKITYAAPCLEIDGVTCVMDCSDGAREAWRKEPWG